jgi:hypothetical protein
MIPLRDASRTPVRLPVMTVSLIVITVRACAWEIGSDQVAIVGTSGDRSGVHAATTGCQRSDRRRDGVCLVTAPRDRIKVLWLSGVRSRRDSRDAHRSRDFISSPRLRPRRLSASQRYECKADPVSPCRNRRGIGLARCGDAARDGEIVAKTPSPDRFRESGRQEQRDCGRVRAAKLQAGRQ